MKKEESISDKSEDDKDDKDYLDDEPKDVDKKENYDNKNNKENDKALFIQRLFAFIIDTMIVSLVVSLIATPFINEEKINSLNEQAIELSQKLMDNDITFNDYYYQYMDLTYDIARNNGIVTFISVSLGIIYFVVFQIYNNGQTFGKKFMKIKVISENGDLTMNQMIFRALISNSILVDLLTLVFLIFTGKQVYFYCVGLFSLVHYIITIISIFMVMYSKNGYAVHDKLVHTKVVRTN